MISSAILYGVLLSGVNFLLSIIVAVLAFRGVFNNFLNSILLSMLIRYMIVAGIIWHTLSISTKPEALNFGLSFMISTFIFILLEIIIFHYGSNYLNLQNIDKC